jgi:hypothetical protein
MAGVGRNCMKTSQFVRLIFAKYYSDDQIKEHGMDGACSTHGEMRKSYTILVEKLMRRDHA